MSLSQRLLLPDDSSGAIQDGSYPVPQSWRCQSSSPGELSPQPSPAADWHHRRYLTARPQPQSPHIRRPAAGRADANSPCRGKCSFASLQAPTASSASTRTRSSSDRSQLQPREAAHAGAVLMLPYLQNDLSSPSCSPDHLEFSGIDPDSTDPRSNSCICKTCCVQLPPVLGPQTRQLHLRAGPLPPLNSPRSFPSPVRPLHP